MVKTCYVSLPLVQIINSWTTYILYILPNITEQCRCSNELTKSAKKKQKNICPDKSIIHESENRMYIMYPLKPTLMKYKIIFINQSIKIQQQLHALFLEIRHRPTRLVEYTENVAPNLSTLVTTLEYFNFQMQQH